MALDTVTLYRGRGIVQLFKSEDLIGLRPRASTSIEQALGTTPTSLALPAAPSRLGPFELLQVDDPAILEESLDLLRSDEQIESGTHVFHTHGGSVPYVSTGELVLRFQPDADLEDCQACLDDVALDSSEPAIRVFVRRKVEAKWLPPGEAIVKSLDEPGGLECPVDVVEGDVFSDRNFVTQPTPGKPDVANMRAVPGHRTRPEAALTEKNLLLRDRLRGWTDLITPGSQLYGKTVSGDGYYGTLGCFVQDTATGDRGLLTNEHVADHAGNVLRFPSAAGRRVGTVTRTVEYITDESRFGGLVDEKDAFFRIDYAFLKQHPDLPTSDTDPRLPIPNSKGGFDLKQVEAPTAIDLDTMGLVGEKVMGIGRTRALQTGTVHAMFYEYRDLSSASVYTDLLIEGDDEAGFSAGGDSGKLIVTVEKRRVVGLHWGGARKRLWSDRQQVKWSYGIDINLVLASLKVDLIR
jgi:hypothetical protein